MRQPTHRVPLSPFTRPYLVAAFAGALTAAVLVAWIRRRTDS